MLTLEEIKALPQGTILYIAGGSTPNMAKISFVGVKSTMGDKHHIMHKNGGFHFEILTTRDKGAVFLDPDKAMKYQDHQHFVRFAKERDNLKTKIRLLNSQLVKMDLNGAGMPDYLWFDFSKGESND